jgi:hypothetical protein
VQKSDDGTNQEMSEGHLLQTLKQLRAGDRIPVLPEINKEPKHVKSIKQEPLKHVFLVCAFRHGTTDKWPEQLSGSAIQGKSQWIL